MTKMNFRGLKHPPPTPDALEIGLKNDIDAGTRHLLLSM